MSPRETFRDFMARALYDPEKGYYMQASHPAAPDRDYVTASQHPLFAACMARFLQGSCKDIPLPALADVGAGSGAFLLNLIAFLDKDDPALLERLHFYAVEKVRRIRHPKVHHILNLQDLPRIEGCIFSFELFDALPCHAMVQEADGLKELYVQDGAFAPGPLSDPRLSECIERFRIPPKPGQRFEICLEAGPLYERMASKLGRGALLTFDYGSKASTLYRPSIYPDGTLMSHSEHHFDREVLKNPGRKDITYAVNFTDLIEEGEQLGLKTKDLRSLSAFLSDAGAGLPFEMLLAGPFPARDLLFGAIGQDIKVLIQHTAG